MDYYLLPPLLCWNDIPDPVTTPDNILESEFPTDPTPALIPKTPEGDGSNLLDLDSQSVTSFDSKTGDISNPIFSKDEPENTNEGIKIKGNTPKKVQVKKKRLRMKNVILSQFSQDPRTDSLTLSCVWNSESDKSDLKTHIESSHEEQTEVAIRDSRVEDTKRLPVHPLQVLSTQGASSGSKFTSRTSNTSPVVLQQFAFYWDLPRHTTDSDDLQAVLQTWSEKNLGNSLIWFIVMYLVI